MPVYVHVLKQSVSPLGLERIVSQPGMATVAEVLALLDQDVLTEQPPEPAQEDQIKD